MSHKHVKSSSSSAANSGSSGTSSSTTTVPSSPVTSGQINPAAAGSPSKILYVATNGSDSNPGTITQPFATISAAASAATPGTEILVRAGTYTSPVKVSNSGTANANITIQPYSGESVVLDGSSLPARTDVVTITANYVTFQGFDIRNSPAVGIDAWATHNVTIANNTIHGSTAGGIWVGGDTAGQSSDNAILNNTVYGNVLSNTAGQASSGWPEAVSADLAANTHISGNTVYNNYGEGIGSLRSTGTVISQNTVHDNYSVNIYLDNSPSATVNGNFTYSTGQSAYFIHGHAAEGIAAAIESYSTQQPDSNITITNNVDVGDDYGFYYGDYGHGGGMQNALIANNTFENEGRAALNIDNDPASSGNQIINNIFYSATSNTLASGSASGFNLGHNLWSGGSYSGFAGSGDVHADPQLVNPGAMTASGAAVLSSSPAMGAGSAISQLTTDYSGASRTVPYTIGAFQS